MIIEPSILLLFVYEFDNECNVIDSKKPALTRVQRSMPAVYL